MNIKLHLAVVFAVCLCIAEGAPEGRMTRKQQRPTRGFKNIEMQTARGFGKRARTERGIDYETLLELPNSDLPQFVLRIGSDFGKRTPELESEDERVKFRPKGPLMVAYDFGKRSGNDVEDKIRKIFTPRPGALFGSGFGKRKECNNTDNQRQFVPSPGMLYAPDFGKRQESKTDEKKNFKPRSGILTARGFGKRQEDNRVFGMENLWDNQETIQDKDGEEASDEKTFESIPLDWFVNEISNNPDFARSVVRKFIDLNQDGLLSTDELLRNV